MLRTVIQVIFIFSQIAMLAGTQDSLRQEIFISPERAKAKLYNDYSITFQNANWDSALIMSKKALYYSKTYENREEAIRAYYSIGKAYIFIGDTDFAEKFLDSAELLNHNDFPQHQAEIMLNKGIIQEFKGVYDIALEHYQKALSIAEQVSNKQIFANALNSLGIVNKELGNYEEAEKYLKLALEEAIKEKNANNQAVIYNNLGIVYDLKNDAQNAIKNYEKALEINKNLRNTIAVAYTEHNMAVIFSTLEQFQKARELFKKSLQTALEQNDAVAQAYNLYYLATLDFNQNDINKALNTSTKSLNIASRNKLYKATYLNFKLLSQIHKRKNNKTLALDYFEKYARLKDSIYSAENREYFEQLQSVYQKDRMQKKLNLLEKEQRLNQLKLEKSEAIIKSRNIILIIISLTAIVILAFGIILYRQMQAKKQANSLLQIKNEEINQQNEEIRTQRDHLEKLNKTLEKQALEIIDQNQELQKQKNLATTQRDKIYEQKQSLTDNIAYASRIQKALVPSNEQFKNAFAEWFILNRPQTMVGGDFYWVHKTHSQVILSVADCTGHGVTGGFISILGISLLNDIIIRQNITQTDQILNELRQQIISLLHQNNTNMNNQDGMDISIIKFDTDKKTYQFSGANQRIYMINKQTKQLNELIGDKMPISIFKDKLTQFTATEGVYSTNDIFYLFTDGFPDQFGGRSDRKFLYKNFKKLLLEHSTLSLDDQYEQIVTSFYEWKGMTDQIDDVLVIGVKP